MRKNAFVNGIIIMLVIMIMIVSYQLYMKYNSYDNENFVIELSSKKLEITVDDTFQMKDILKINNINNLDIIWNSSDDSIVSVDNDGKITAKKSGEADIKVRTDNGKEAVCHVIVKKVVAIDSISLNKTSVKLVYDSAVKLSVNIQPSNATESITWSSSNDKIAKVDNDGLVKAQGIGSTIITVTGSNGKQAKCKVQVEPYIKEDGYPYVYKDESANLTIEKKLYNSTLTGKKTYYYQIHLLLNNYSRLHSDLTYNRKDSEGKYLAKEISKKAVEDGAILALEGDYKANSNYGTIRDGVFYYKTGVDPSKITTKTGCFGYYSKISGIMDDCNKLKSTTLVEALANKELTDTFRFGGNLLVDGKNQYDKDPLKRPRQANFIGYVKPGEYYFIVSEGYAYSDGDYLSDNVSYGFTTWEKGELLKNLGCKFGTQLDGGGSVIVWFRGKQLQSRAVITTERDYLTDYVYFK